MDGWRSVSPKTSHVIAIRKIETPRMVARGARECGDGIFFALPDRMFIPCGSEAESVSSRYDHRDTPNYLGLYGKVNPGLVVRDKQGRSCAEREFSEEDRGYKAAPRVWGTSKVAVLSNGHSFVSGNSVRLVNPLGSAAPYQAHRAQRRATSRSCHHRGRGLAYLRQRNR